MTSDCFKRDYIKLDEVPRFINKKWAEVHDQSGSADDRYKPSKQ